MVSGCVREGDAHFPLGLLPGDCLAAVLSHCSPRDVGRSACVSTTFRRAAESRDAWARLAPWLSQLSEAFPDLQAAPSPRAAFTRLLGGVGSSDGAYFLRVDADGKPALHVSVAHKLGAIWMDDSGTYWEKRECVQGSHFRLCAYLQSVCWFHIGPAHVRPTFPLPGGRYTVSWKVAKHPAEFHWDRPPLQCSLRLGPSGLTEYKAEWAELEGVLWTHELDLQSPGVAYSTQDLNLLLTGRQRATSTAAGQRTRKPWYSRFRARVGMHHEEPIHQESTRDVDRPDKWEVYQVGEVFLENLHCDLDVTIDLQEVTSTWKGGLFVDSVVFTMT